MADIWGPVASGAALAVLLAVICLGWLWLGRAMDRAFFGPRGGSVPDSDPGPVPFGFAEPVTVPDGYPHAGTVALDRYARAFADSDCHCDVDPVACVGRHARSGPVAAAPVVLRPAATPQRGGAGQRMGQGMT